MGFVGILVIFDVFVENNVIVYVYRMFEEKVNLFWLYLVFMGVIIIWERWDSMFLDGFINLGMWFCFDFVIWICLIDFFGILIWFVKFRWNDKVSWYFFWC